MNNITKIPGRENSRRSEIEAQARTWVIRLDGDPGKKEVLKFRAWLQSSPLHREIFRQASETWSDMDRLSDTYFAHRDRRPGVSSLPRFAYASGIVLAVLILLVAVTTSVLNHDNVNTVAGTGGESTAYKTAIGEIKTIALPDGSNVNLNTDTSMNVAYNRETRFINLEAGEAYFEVAHGVDKPFVVRAGNYLVRATGTAFSVKMLNGSLNVLVSDGQVDIKALKHTPAKDGILDLQSIDRSELLATLGRDQKIVLGGNNEKARLIQRVEPRGVEKTLSWRDGMLMYDNDPLEKVIADINRYTNVKVVISDSRIRDIRFGGYFRISDISSILATMEENFGIRVDRISDKVIYLSLNEESKTGA